jgi:hypothetical protein
MGGEIVQARANVPTLGSEMMQARANLGRRDCGAPLLGVFAWTTGTHMALNFWLQPPHVKREEGEKTSGRPPRR